MQPFGVNNFWLSRQRLQQLLMLVAGGAMLFVMTHDLLHLTEDRSTSAEELFVTTTPSPCGDTESCHLGRPIRELWDERRPEQAWFSDPECHPLVTRFTRDHSLPLVYLASFPRSGNTWLGRMVEMSSGVFTSGAGPTYREYRRNTSYRGSKLTYDDIASASKPGKNEFIDLGFKGQEIPGDQGITIISRTHMWPEPWSKREADGLTEVLSSFPEGTPRKAVVLIRDPFKALISFRKLFKTGSALVDDKPEFYQGAEWKKFVTHYAQEWYNFNVRWIRSTNKTYLVNYELLEQFPVQEVTSVLNFLDIKPDPSRMACLKRLLDEGQHKDRHTVVPNDKTFPAELRTGVWTHVHMLNMLLLAKGYDGLKISSYSFGKEFADIYKDILNNGR